MGVLDNLLLVGEDGLLRPQRIGGATASVRVVHVVRAVCYGIFPSHYNFFVILEKYTPDNCTFLTPVGEMGSALHVMFEISGLFIGDLPY